MLALSTRLFIASLTICSLFLFLSCTQTNRDYNAVEIDFLHVRTFEEGDWIEIDGVRFNHVKAFEDVDVNMRTLPASRITRGAERRSADYTEPFPSLNIGYLLASYLHNMNKKDELMVDHDYTYKILKPDLLQALGKLRFMRTDSTKIQIKTSPDYPAEIRSIPIE